MLESAGDFFSSSNFMPHGHCYLWQPLILWTHVIADAVIGLSYVAISLTLYYFVKKRKDLRFSFVFVAFAIFILACGAGHFMDIVTIWNPIYGVEGLVKAVTAIASISTAILLWPLMPRAMRIPSIQQLEDKNEALRQMNEKYTLLVEGSEVGVMEWPSVRDKNIVTWSGRLFQLLGYDPHTFHPSFEHFAALIHPEDHDRVQTAFDMALRGQPVGPIEFRVCLQGGRERWFRSRQIVRFDQQQRPVYLVSSIEDIHQQKETEEQLRRVNQTLEEEVRRRVKQLQIADEAKNRFLANMSHEIRTPLGLILGFSELLSGNNSLDTEAKDYVTLISKNGDILSRVVNDLLDLSKVEAGKLQFFFSEFGLDALVEEIRWTFQERAQKKNLSLQFVNETPRGTHVVSDEIRLKQIIYNLISNAIKFTEQGNIDVRFGVLPDRPMYFVDVIDTGIGVPPVERDKIFLEFVRGDMAVRMGSIGSGLGLRLSRNLTQALGGNLELIRSDVGVGSHFRLVFPSQPEKIPSKVAKPVEKAAQDNIEGLRVMVLDDNEDNIRLAQIFLKKLGCKVEGFTQPQPFIQKVIAQPPDLVLLDINMPEMSGFDVFTELRTRGFKNKIWALTAYAMTDDIQQILQHGFEAYLRKPVSLDNLRRKLTFEFKDRQNGNSER